VGDGVAETCLVALGPGWQKTLRPPGRIFSVAATGLRVDKGIMKRIPMSMEIVIHLGFRTLLIREVSKIFNNRSLAAPG
jgi:hypothetical protein